uniref:Ferritin n=1 Tax=Lates calcarifer TaxID=8187 RepID=A0A4W6G4X7_LATCA
MQSVVKQNLHSESEGDINKLINLKLNASYTYLALGMYFDRDDVALPKFSSFFLERSVTEREQAEKLLEYQNMRGGRILLQTIAVSLKCPITSVISKPLLLRSVHLLIHLNITFSSRNQVGRIGEVVWMHCPFPSTTRSPLTRVSLMCTAELATTLTLICVTSSSSTSSPTAMTPSRSWVIMLEA